MNSAAIRLLGSSVFCLRDASLSNLLRVAAVACGSFALDDQAQLQGWGELAGSGERHDFVGLHVMGQSAPVGDEVERAAVRPGQAERAPADADDDIGLVAAERAEPLHGAGAGEVAVGDADLTGDRRAAGDRLGAAVIGQFEMREASASEIVDCVRAPVGGFAAALADAGAVAGAQDAAGPTYCGAGRCGRELMAEDRCKKLDRLVEAILHGRAAHLGKAEHGGPGSGLAQRQSARAARQ